MCMDEWRAQLESERREKDRFFAGHWQSPIPPEERAEFRGLAYYPPDPNYRFEVELLEHGEKEFVRMAYTKGEEQDFVRWGEFRLRIDGEDRVLQAYKREAEQRHPFIPSGMQPLAGKRTARGATSILTRPGTAPPTGNGFSTLIGRIIPGVYIRRSTRARLCQWRIGSWCRCVPVRRITGRGSE